MGRLFTVTFVSMFIFFIMFTFGCATGHKPNVAQIKLACSSFDDGNVKGFFLGESLEVKIVEGSCEEVD